MRQRVLVGGLWVIAAVLAMAVVNRGIAAVGDVARGSLTATVPGNTSVLNPSGSFSDTSAIEEKPHSADGSDDSAPTTLSPTPSTTTTPTPTTSIAAVTTTSRTVAKPTTRPAVTAAPTTTTTTTAPTPTTTITPPTTTAPAIRVTLVTSGGTAWVLYAPTSVTLDTAIPDDGYHTEVTQIDSSTVEIEFESNDDPHKVTLTATWSDGPSHSIEESGD